MLTNTRKIPSGRIAPARITQMTKINRMPPGTGNYTGLPLGKTSSRSLGLGGGIQKRGLSGGVKRTRPVSPLGSRNVSTIPVGRDLPSNRIRVLPFPRCLMSTSVRALVSPRHDFTSYGSDQYSWCNRTRPSGMPPQFYCFRPDIVR